MSSVQLVVGCIILSDQGPPLDLCQLARCRQRFVGPEHLEFALRGVKCMDDYIADPACILLLISGLTLLVLNGYRLTMLWLLVMIIFKPGL